MYNDDTVQTASLCLAGISVADDREMQTTGTVTTKGASDSPTLMGQVRHLCAKPRPTWKMLLIRN
jgi:hypothetical protein